MKFNRLRHLLSKMSKKITALVAKTANYFEIIAGIYFEQSQVSDTLATIFLAKQERNKKDYAYK